MFEPWLTKWSLAADGGPLTTPSSRLLPVRRDRAAGMLKITEIEEEKRGGGLMEWWAGDGAARVLARENGALLLERAEGNQSLARYSLEGRDDEASVILCRAAARLHAPRRTPTPPLMPLEGWFAALGLAARAHGGYLQRSSSIAEELLAAPREMSVLHGDIHHDNVLDFGPRGWLAIDPKGLYGERGFDFANLFCNPDMGKWNTALPTRPEIFERRLEVVSEEAKIGRRRLVEWIIAYTGLSAAWTISDGAEPDAAFAIGALAEAALAG